ncbi:MAG TPA: hypothetical protein VHB97_05080 [Polyangia bacterium]|nr:hypothetical protein [Polyangia bacterium]
MTREIVQAHGGTIAADSTATDGTTFFVVLPRHPIARAGERSAGSWRGLSRVLVTDPTRGKTCARSHPRRPARARSGIAGPVETGGTSPTETRGSSATATACDRCTTTPRHRA